MSQVTDLFDFENLFSKKNPILKSVEKTHRRIFESFDKAARLQLSFAEDLLNLNRKRFEALYAGDSLPEMVTAQQELVTEFGKRTATWVGDLRDVVVDLQSDVGNAANDLVKPVVTRKPAARPKKAVAKKAVVKKARAKKAA
jgi:hypothetical protein